MNQKHVMKKFSREQLRAQRLAQKMQSEELVTPFRLLIVLIVSASLITAISFSASSNEPLVYDSEDEINLTSSPYVFSFEKAMRSREDNFEAYNHAPHQWVVEKRSKLSLDEFWDIYDCKWPVIITDVVEKWPAMNWSKDFFMQMYGKERVMVKINLNDYGHTSTGVLELGEFIQQLDKAKPNAWTYLEDELFMVARPELKKYIGSNIYTEENFFNLFPMEVKPWDCLFLWGTKYSRSNLHMDPYNWTATNAVISGIKKWKLFPPGQDDLLYIYKDRKCHFPLDCKKYDSPIDATNPDLRKYPKFKKAKYLEVEQLPGELLIIPTGWYHQAFNTMETLAISGQLMNRNNYLVVLEEIIKGKNIKRKKLPAHFNTLLPPDQVKLFLSLLNKKVLQRGKEMTDVLMKDMYIQNSVPSENKPTEKV